MKCFTPHQQSPARGNSNLHPSCSGDGDESYDALNSNRKRILPKLRRKCQEMSLLNAQPVFVTLRYYLCTNIRSWGLIKAWVCSYKPVCWSFHPKITPKKPQSSVPSWEWELPWVKECLPTKRFWLKDCSQGYTRNGRDAPIPGQSINRPLRMSYVGRESVLSVFVKPCVN